MWSPGQTTRLFHGPEPPRAAGPAADLPLAVGSSPGRSPSSVCQCSPPLLAAGRDNLTLATDLLLFLVATVGIALLGGVVVGTVAAVFASVLANWFFVEPVHTLTVSDPENIVAIAIFVAAAIGASVLVDRISRRSREAFQARAEAGALARTSGILIGAPDPLPELLDQLRVTFGLQSVSLLSNRDDGWVVDASVGDDPPTDPYHGDSWDLVADGTSVVVLSGAQLSADDQRVLRTFLSNLAVALESRRLQAEAGVAAHLAEGDQLRTALLAGGEPRSPDPAGLHQGVGQQPPPVGRGRGTASRSARSHRPSIRPPIASTSSSATCWT